MGRHFSRLLGTKDFRRSRRFSAVWLLAGALLILHFSSLGEQIFPFLLDRVGSIVVEVKSKAQFLYADLENTQNGEFERLKRENEQLRVYVARLYIQQQENKELRRALRYVENVREDFITLDVVGNVVPTRPFLISGGKTLGIQPGQYVIALGGLVGVVDRVGQSFSFVRPITHPLSRIPAKLLEGHEKAIVRGNGSNYLDIFYEKPSHKKVFGTIFVTDNFSGKTLKNIFLGRLNEIGQLCPVFARNQFSRVHVLKTGEGGAAHG